MKKLCLIFDYFKEAYHISKGNKRLYLPQIILIIIKTLMVVGMGVLFYSDLDRFFSMPTAGALQFFGRYLITFAVLLLGYGTISLVIESGLYNMYKKAVITGSLEGGEFSEGVGKYFFKFLLGYIVLLLIFILSIPVFAIVGIVTVTIGISLLVLIMGIYLTMWKISLVMNDCGVIEAFKNSFKFAHKNFIPVAVMQLIHWAFSAGPTKGGSPNFSNVANLRNSVQNTGVPLPNNIAPTSLPGLDYEFLRVFKTIILILIPVISVVTLIGALIKMIFEVFFALALVIAYKNGFTVEEPIETLEIVHDTEAADDAEAVETQEQNKQDGEVLS